MSTVGSLFPFETSTADFSVTPTAIECCLVCLVPFSTFYCTVIQVSLTHCQRQEISLTNVIMWNLNLNVLPQQITGHGRPRLVRKRVATTKSHNNVRYPIHSFTPSNTTLPTLLENSGIMAEDRHYLSEPRPCPGLELPSWEVDVMREGVDVPIMTFVIDKTNLPPGRGRGRR